MPGSLGHKLGYTIDGVLTHHRAQAHTHSHTQSYIMGNLVTPVSQQSMSVTVGETRVGELEKLTKKLERTHKFHACGL